MAKNDWMTAAQRKMVAEAMAKRAPAKGSKSKRATTSRRSVSPMSDTELEEAYKAGYIMALRNTITSLEQTIDVLRSPEFVSATEGDHEQHHDDDQQNGVNASDPSE